MLNSGPCPTCWWTGGFHEPAAHAAARAAVPAGLYLRNRDVIAAPAPARQVLTGAVAAAIAGQRGAATVVPAVPYGGYD